MSNQQYPPQSPQPKWTPNWAPQQNLTQPSGPPPYPPLPSKKKHVGRNVLIGGGILLLGIVAIASQPSFSEGSQTGANSVRTSAPAVVPPAVQATPAAQVTTAAPAASAPATTAPATTAPATTAPAAPNAGPYGVYPAAEAAFIAETQAAITKYQAAKTDLQRSQVMRERNKNLLAIMGSTRVTDWVGVVKTVGANGEGKAYVEIAKGVSLKTWNNAFSDITDGTLIPTDSPFFQTLVSAAPGDKMAFSGSFFPDPDATIRTTNMTETFSVLTPEFLVKFSAIRKP